MCGDIEYNKTITLSTDINNVNATSSYNFPIIGVSNDIDEIVITQFTYSGTAVAMYYPYTSLDPGNPIGNVMVTPTSVYTNVITHIVYPLNNTPTPGNVTIGLKQFNANTRQFVSSTDVGSLSITFQFRRYRK